VHIEDDERLIIADFSRPIFIVSAPRSGSTLLRLILDSHPRLAVPAPTWLFELVYPYLFSYGNLSGRDNFKALVEDILETPPMKNWPIQFDVDELVDASPERTFGAIVDLVHRRYGEVLGKKRWGEKSPRDCFWMDEIRETYADTQFIHIIRDGRDQAIDIVESPGLMPFNIYSGVHLWKLFVGAVLESSTRLDKTNYYEIHYEKICADPETEVRKLCDYLGEDFDGSMLRHHETKEASAWGDKPGHEKAAQPITTDYCEMHLRQLGDADRNILDSIIGNVLIDFGYPVAGDKAPPLDRRLAAQLIETDTVSSLRNAAYKKYHQQQRRDRRDAGVWSDDDRTSKLWGLS